MMWGIPRVTEVTPENVGDVVRRIEKKLEVNLTSSSARQSVNTRRVVVNVLLSQTGWSATEMAQYLHDAGISGNGWSRRSLSWYKTTAEDILTTSPGESAVYNHNYQLVSSLIIK